MMDKVINIIKKRDFTLPQILLQNYIKMQISHEELIMIIYLINTPDTIYNPKLISQELSWSLEKVMETVHELTSKAIITIEVKKSQNGMEENICLDNLYNKIAFLLTEEKEENDTDLFSLFEKEFGRTLSPIEYELINGWIDSKLSDELILLALKEAVYNGVSNFRYIDKILYEWNRKGIKSKDDVQKQKQQFHKQKINTKDLFEYDWLNDNE